jgi:acetyl esterase/lipase
VNGGRRGSGPALAGAVLLAPVLLLAGCGDSGTEVGPHDVGGVDLDALFAPPTAAELAAVEGEWAARTPAARDVRVERTASVSLGGSPATLRVLSHEVDGARHYGAVAAPDGVDDGALPVLVYAHGGDGGVDVSELLLLAFALGERADDFVFVVPSFRSESLRLGDETFLSEGAPSPWDRDVDDALALLDAALGATPAADPTRIAVLGASRGGGVALLMGVRDARIDRVVDLFGPTDFFGPYVQGIVERALRGSPPDLPGVTYLDQAYIQPLALGTVDVATARRELIRRSAALFVSRLPSVQIHHGTADDVVDVGQAERLIAALEAAGRGPPDDEWFLYTGGRHDPLSLPGSFDRIDAFLARLGG